MAEVHEAIGDGIEAVSFEAIEVQEKFLRLILKKVETRSHTAKVLSCSICSAVCCCKVWCFTGRYGSSAPQRQALSEAMVWAMLRHQSIRTCSPVSKIILFILKVHQYFKRCRSKLPVQLPKGQSGFLKILDALCIRYFVLFNNIAAFLVDYSLIS